MFSVVCLVCSVVIFFVAVMSQNNEETAEHGAGSAALQLAGGSSGSPEPEALPSFKCK